MVVTRPPADLAVTIPKWDRHWVANALLDAAIALEAETRAGRKRTTQGMKQNLEIAGRLRELARIITP